MSLSRLLFSVALGWFVWLSAIPARADGLPPPLPPEWNVSGALLLVGNNVCAGLPCTETVAFSFDVGYQFLPNFNAYEAYLTDLVGSGSGALGSFIQSDVGPFFLGNPIFPFNDPAGLLPGACIGSPDAQLFGFAPGGNGINLHLCQAFVSTPAAPSISGADLYSCQTSTCLTDFAPAPFQGHGLPQNGIFLFGPVEFTVTAIPEPATLTLLFSGLLLLGLGAASRKF
jgi:hypothetical protein